MRLSVLSPRGGERALADLASIHGLTGGQRVSRRRLARRAARRARWLGLGAIALVAALATVGAGTLAVRWLLSSPRFAVADVEVRGASRLSAEDIVRAARIRRGQNLLRLDPEAARMGIESLPQVRRADVIRAWPNRVTVLVEERRPFTLVHAGRLHWVDEEGRMLAAESRAVQVGLPVISGLTAEELADANRSPSPRVTTGLSLIRLLLRSGSPLTSQISEVDVSRHDGPVLYTVDGIEVRLGADEWESRIPRLIGVLAQVKSSGEAVSAIDLRFRDQVVLKPAVR